MASLAGQPGPIVLFGVAQATDAFLSFARGQALDAQVRYGGSQAYANYAFGVFSSTFGLSLSDTLSAANAYGYFKATYPAGTTVQNASYPSIPRQNVDSITEGFNASANGTLCKKPQH